MKLKVITVLAFLFISCTNDKKSTKIPKKEALLISDVLLRTIAEGPYTNAHSNDELTLTISGKNFLKATATFQVIDDMGREVHCETFPAIDLIQPEYKTANSTLQEVHIKEVAAGYFVDYSRSDFKTDETYVGVQQ